MATRRDFLASCSVTGGATVLGGLSPVLAQVPVPTPAPVSSSSHGGLKVGYVLSSEQFPNTRLVQLAAQAEAAGFDAAWSSDHFQPWQPNEGHTSQAWVTLAAVGQRSSRLFIGTGVCCPAYRYHPAIVAEAFASLGQLYPGRVFLGVGTGEALNEVAATGDRFPHYRERAARLAEAVELIRRLWTGQMTTFEGHFYQVRHARLYDVPSVPVPIYIAGNGPKSAHLAGLHGDGWITTLKLLEDPKVRDAFEAGARAAGKDPARLAIVLESFVVNGTHEQALPGAEKWRFTPYAWKRYVTDPDPRDIQKRADREVPLSKVMEDWTISTDLHQHAEALRKAHKAGATMVMVHSPLPDQSGFIDFYRHVLTSL
ncbi:MAG TPA: TIGR03557 family F420-dependent LLM class oxidoreductase [Candidatus Xenobia bacterium]|jgi:TAT-translocated FGD2 family F420-dependent dehydrogenase